MNSEFIAGDYKYDVKYPIAVDVLNRAISVGCWVADEIYYNHPMDERRLGLKEKILKANGYTLQSWANPEVGYLNVHKEICPLLGPKFYAQLRAITRKLWIEPIEEYLNKYCLCFYSTKRPYFDEGQLRRAWSVLSDIKQLEKDNMQNVAPFVIYFMLTPSALKKELGKSIWKKIANNSLTFNKAIVQNLIRLEGVDAKQRTVRFKAQKLQLNIMYLSVLLTLKKSLAKNLFQYVLSIAGSENYAKSESELYRDMLLNDSLRDAIFWLNKYSKVSISRDVLRLSALYRDTIRLCRKFGVVFKPVSLNKMESLHDRLVREERIVRREELKSQVGPIDRQMQWLKPYSDAAEQVFSGGRVKVEIIADYLRLLEEGEELSHCVAGYVDSICDGNYIVVSLESDIERSTLGLYRISDKEFQIDQHVVLENDNVKCTELLTMTSAILKTINAISMSLVEKNKAA